MTTPQFPHRLDPPTPSLTCALCGTTPLPPTLPTDIDPGARLACAQRHADAIRHATKPGKAHGPEENRRTRPIEELRSSGLLWLINRVVFHPRGVALALSHDQAGHVTGWHLLGDGADVWTFTGDGEDELYALAEATLAAARVAPPGSKMLPAGAGTPAANLPRAPAGGGQLRTTPEPPPGEPRPDTKPMGDPERTRRR